MFFFFHRSVTKLHTIIFQGKPPDWQDFIGIITLLVINSTISFIEENNAGNAAASLMARLAPKTKVKLMSVDWKNLFVVISWQVVFESKLLNFAIHSPKGANLFSYRSFETESGRSRMRKFLFLETLSASSLVTSSLLMLVSLKEIL